jgi:hypothetical protein
MREQLETMHISLPGVLPLVHLDFADLGRIAGDADQAVEEPVGIFCALSVIR